MSHRKNHGNIVLIQKKFKVTRQIVARDAGVEANLDVWGLSIPTDCLALILQHTPTDYTLPMAIKCACFQTHFPPLPSANFFLPYKVGFGGDFMSDSRI